MNDFKLSDWKDRMSVRGFRVLQRLVHDGFSIPTTLPVLRKIRNAGKKTAKEFVSLGLAVAAPETKSEIIGHIHHHSMMLCRWNKKLNKIIEMESKI